MLDSYTHTVNTFGFSKDKKKNYANALENNGKTLLHIIYYARIPFIRISASRFSTCYIHTHFFSLFPYVLHKISSDFLLTICEHYVLAVHVYSRSPKRMCTSVYYNENPSNVLLLLFVGFFFLCVLVLLAARCVQSDLFLSCSFSLVLLVWLIPLDNFGVCVLKQCQRTHIMLTIALHARYM